MTNSPEMRALDPAVLANRAKKLDAGGGLGYAAHDFLTDLIAYFAALSAPHAQGDVTGLVAEIAYLRADRIMEANEHLKKLLGAEHPSHCAVWFKSPCSCGLGAEIADAEAHIRGISPADDDRVLTPEHGWTCFHCGETFHSIAGARRHFGSGPESVTCPFLPHSDGAVTEPERPMHLRGGFETKHGRFSSKERAQVVLSHATFTGIIGEVMSDGEADFVSDSGDGMTVKWGFFRKLDSPINPVPAGVGVKELEWELRIGTSATFDAFSALGVYTAWVDDAGVAFYAVPGGRGRMAGSIEAAKKASQAHFDALIRSALIPRQAPDAEQGAGE